MALGKQQKERIGKWWRPEGYRLEAYYSDRYYNSRETGRGYPVMLKVVHIESGDIEHRFEIARCQSEFECERKVTEITEYVAQLGN